MYNLAADLAKNLKVFSDFANARAAACYPEKMEVPLVWDLYLDTARPVGTPLTAPPAGSPPELWDAPAPAALSPPGAWDAPVPAALSPPGAWDASAPASVSPPAARVSADPIAAPPDFGGFGDAAVTPVTYRSPVSGDLNLLGLVNDRLKTQARRYPHPITNDMETLGA